MNGNTAQTADRDTKNSFKRLLEDVLTNSKRRSYEYDTDDSRWDALAIGQSISQGQGQIQLATPNFSHPLQSKLMKTKNAITHPDWQQYQRSKTADRIQQQYNNIQGSPYRQYVHERIKLEAKADKLYQKNIKERNKSQLKRWKKVHTNWLLLQKQNELQNQLNQQEELVGCTFKPKILDKSAKLAVRIRSPVEITYQDSSASIKPKSLKKGGRRCLSPDQFYGLQMAYEEKKQANLMNERFQTDSNFVRQQNMNHTNKKSQKITNNQLRRPLSVQSPQFNRSTRGVSPPRIVGTDEADPQVIFHDMPLNLTPDSRLKKRQVKSQMNLDPVLQSFKGLTARTAFKNCNYHNLKSKTSGGIKTVPDLTSSPKTVSFMDKKFTFGLPKSLTTYSDEEKNERKKRKEESKKFKPQISKVTSQLGKMRRQKTMGAIPLFNALHADKEKRRERKNQLSLDRDKKFQQDKQDKQNYNFDKASKQKIIDKFMAEFKKLYNDQVKEGALVYLLDILEDLHFVDPKLIQNKFDVIERMINENNINITINLNIKSPKKVKENLKKIFLAILDIDWQVESGKEPINDEIFKAQMNSIKQLRNNIEDKMLLLLTQIDTIKVFAYQSDFTFTHKQQKEFALAMHEFRHMRRDLTYESGKSKRIQRSVDHEKAKFRERPNIKSLQQERKEKKQKLKMDKLQAQLKTMDPLVGKIGPVGITNLHNVDKIKAEEAKLQKQMRKNEKPPNEKQVGKKVTEKLYKHGYQQQIYKKLLQKWYEKKNKHSQKKIATFRPQISQTSKELAKRNIRIPVHLDMKIREEQDKNELEFQRNMEECTFQPQIPQIPFHKTVKSMKADAGKGPKDSDYNTQTMTASTYSYSKSTSYEQQARFRESIKRKGKKKKGKSGGKEAELDLMLGFTPEQDDMLYTPIKEVEEITSLDIQSPRGAATERRQARTRKSQRTSQLSNTITKTRTSNLLPTVEEPMCVLKIHVEKLQAPQEIRIFENDNPIKVVEDFAQKNKLSEQDKMSLIQQIHQQINMMDESNYN